MTGHSILHELTHLDTLAQASGLEAPAEGQEDAGRHGTGDYQSGCQLRGARDWKVTWENDKDHPSPDYNAESYAGAATGMYNFILIGRLRRRPGGKGEKGPCVCSLLLLTTLRLQKITS